MTSFEEDPHAVAMVLADPPEPGSSDVLVTKVETVEDYRTAIEIACECFGMDDAHRAEALAAAEREFLLVREHGAADTFLAWVDGQAVARATAVYTDAGVCLFGGATVEQARGRGAYRALVAARWDEAVRRGTPALVTHAGKMSRPILTRLGFLEVAEIRILLDALPA
jgi:GNAT superfamily N-acetyltransferase